MHRESFSSEFEETESYPDAFSTCVIMVAAKFRPQVLRGLKLTKAELKPLKAMGLYKEIMGGGEFGTWKYDVALFTHQRSILVLVDW